jgi:N-acyl homoserine lactone hydrolase
MLEQTAMQGATGLAAFPCGLCHSPIGGEPSPSPYFMYLIGHPKGSVLFDCGLPNEHLTGETTITMDEVTYRIEADNDCSASACLASFGLRPNDLAAVVLSHLHFDHAGGMPLLGDVRTLVQRDELAASADGADTNPLWARPLAQAGGSHVVPLDGDYDVFGDGSVVVLQAPGHTPGHQCLLVRLQTGECFILGADIVYYPSQFRDRDIPTIAWSKEVSLLTCERVARVMKDTGARLLLSHDPDYRETIRVAPDHWYGTPPGPGRK